MRRAAQLLAAVAAAAGAAPAGIALAQTDPGAPEGAVQTAHTVRSFDRYDLPVGSRSARRRARCVPSRAPSPGRPGASMTSRPALPA